MAQVRLYLFTVIAEGNGSYPAGSLEDYLQHEFHLPYPAAIPNCDINQYTWYDSYNFDPTFPFYGRGFSSQHSSDYLATDFYVTPQPASFVQGLPVATRIRVTGATNPFPDSWTSTLIFYDGEGRPIQTQTAYPWTGSNAWDIASTQYTFRGQVARTILTHQAAVPGCPKTSTKMMVARVYEPGGLSRLQSVTMTLDNGPAVRLSLYDYDDLGRVKTKDIDNGLEKQQFTYNIRGQLTGINAGYVTNPAWPNATFGINLCYDYGFSDPRYDGGISGVKWRGAGSGSFQRAYGYSYDKAGRMTGADFNQRYKDPIMGNNPVWDHAVADYSVRDITYDANGNMEAMSQRGMAPGYPQPVDIDNLTYTYKPYSNRLDQVEDGLSPGNENGWNLGDFVNNNQGSTDYGYDADGNLTSDANKGIASITYNAQDLPTDVIADNGDEVHNTYDAAGTLLQKTVMTGGVVSKRYTYCGPFVYDKNLLSHVLHEEGRARWLSDTLAWRYDYFIKDHLGNVRTTITRAGGQATQYLATHELPNIPQEHQLFRLGHMAAKAGSTTPADVTAVELHGSYADKRIGTSLLLKVMAGDKFTADVSAYYDQNAVEDGEGCGTSGVLEALTSALSGGITSTGQAEGVSTELVGGMLSDPALADAYTQFTNSMSDPSQPKAYLNWVLFDEDMKVVGDQSGMAQVSMSHANQWANLGTGTEIVAGKNGYLVVFMSNNSPRPVLMDNLHVSYSRGRLLEEQHYYPHGLAVREGANTPLVNRYLYQGKELQDEAGLQLYDFGARQYDPQIGRFWGIDPMDQFASGYTGMGNDPANMIDPTGMLSTGAGFNGSPGSSMHTTNALEGFEGIGANTSILDDLLRCPGNGLWGNGGGGGGSSAQGDGEVAGLSISSTASFGGAGHKNGDGGHWERKADANYTIHEVWVPDVSALEQGIQNWNNYVKYSSDPVLDLMLNDVPSQFNENINPFWMTASGLTGLLTGYDGRGRPVRRTDGMALAGMGALGFAGTEIRSGIALVEEGVNLAAKTGMANLSALNPTHYYN